MATALLLALVCSALLSCRAPPERPTPEAPPVTPAPTTGRVFQVVPGESTVRILVWRGGTLARLGHNHVIVSRDLRGQVTLPDDPLQTQFEIVMPVATLTVDEPEQRAREGAEFTSALDASAREGTRKNMLRSEVLDAGRFPDVTVRSRRLMRAGADYRAILAITIRDQTRDMECPLRVRIEGNRLFAGGEFTIRQSEFGITPFTAALGALAVADEVNVKFDMVAATPERLARP